MEPKKKGTEVTYWHPAFYADIQIELRDDADNLIFENEHQLGTNPMEIDVLIIKKEKDRPVKKNIGRIFRKYNIIEYKGPGDSLSIDDFYKVYGYTCFYKADAPFADSIPAQELTITFISEKYPRKFIHHLLEARKYTVEKEDAGIYHVKGDFIPIQIIVTRKLSKKENLWLGSLTNKLNQTESAKRLITDYMNHRENNLYRSVIETIMRANQNTFREVNGMSDIFMEIVQEKFDRKLKEEVAKEVEKKVAKEVEKKVAKEVEKKVAKEIDKEVAKETKKTRLLERISLIQKKCAKNKPLSVIADELETVPDELFSVYDVVFKNPEKTAEEIYELIVE